MRLSLSSRFVDAPERSYFSLSNLSDRTPVYRHDTVQPLRQVVRVANPTITLGIVATTAHVHPRPTFTHHHAVDDVLVRLPKLDQFI